MKHPKRPLALALLISLSACGGGNQSSEADVSQPKPEVSQPKPEVSQPKPEVSQPKPEVSQPKTIAEALGFMKKKGDMPDLDHSTSVPGEDKDGNGVRDDMDAYISSLPHTTAQKAALRQESKAIQAHMTVTDLTDVNTLNAINKQSMRGVFCIGEQYQDHKLAHNMVQKILHYTVNTKERLDAFLAYSAAVNGFTMSSPEGNPCD